MAREINIIIRARNAIAAGLRSAGNSLKEFGQSALNIGKFFATAFLSAGTVLAGFALKAVTSFAEAEKATQAMKSALQAYGDEVPKNLANVQRFAAAIMDETGAEDDNLVARAAQLRMLGVEPGQLEAATKATIALKSAGMDEAAAIKAVAGAREGNFAALTRYLPALKNAATEEEKAAIVNDFLTRGYAQQKGALNTVAGQWELLKNRVGNVWEEIGAAIAQNGELQAMMKRAGDAIKGFGDKIAEWVKGGGVSRLVTTIKLFGENVRDIFAKAKIYTVGFFMGGLYNPAKVAFQYMGSVAGAFVAAVEARFGYLTEYVSAVWAKIKSPGSKFQPPDVGEYKAAVDNLWTALKGGFVDKTPNAFETMNKEIEAEDAKHNQREQAILDDATKQAMEAAQAKADAEISAQDQIAIAAANNAEEIAKLKKREKELAEKVAEAEKDAAIDAQEKKIAALEKVKEKQEELSKKTIQDILAEQKAKKDIEKQDQKDAGRAEELMARQKRGAKLSKKEQDWLAAQQQLAAAKQFMANGQGGLGGLKQQLDGMKEQGKKLGEIKAELAKVHTDLTNLMMRK